MKTLFLLLLVLCACSTEPAKTADVKKATAERLVELLTPEAYLRAHPNIIGVLWNGVYYGKRCDAVDTVTLRYTVKDKNGDEYKVGYSSDSIKAK